MADNNQIYYGARQTVLKMLKDRHYKVPELLTQLTEKEFDILFEKRQMDIHGISDNQEKPVYIRVIEPTRQFNKEKDRVTDFREVAKYFNAIGMNHITDDKTLESSLDNGQIRLIIIYNSRQPGQLQTKYEEEYITHSHIEVYQVHNINIPPKETKYQPKFKLIADTEEITKIYRRYDGKPIMLGSICIDDPMNRYYGGRPAEQGKLAHIYEINRGGTNIFYRKVISKRMNLK